MKYEPAIPLFLGKVLFWGVVVCLILIGIVLIWEEWVVKEKHGYYNTYHGGRLFTFWAAVAAILVMSTGLLVNFIK